MLPLLPLLLACGPKHLPPPPPSEEGQISFAGADLHTAAWLLSASRRLPLMVLGGDDQVITLDLPVETGNQQVLEQMAELAGLTVGQTPIPTGGTLYWLAPADTAQRLASFSGTNGRGELMHLDLVRADATDLLSLLDQETDLRIDGRISGGLSLLGVQIPQAWLVELLGQAANSQVQRKGRSLTLTNGDLPALMPRPAPNCDTDSAPALGVSLACTRPDQMLLQGVSMGTRPWALVTGPGGTATVLQEGDRVGTQLPAAISNTAQFMMVKHISPDRMDLANPFASIGWTLTLADPAPKSDLCWQGEEQVFSCNPGEDGDPGLVSLCGRQAGEDYQLAFRFGLPGGPVMVYPAQPQPLATAFDASHHHRAMVDNLKVSWNADGLQGSIEMDYYAEVVGDEAPPMDAPAYTLTISQGDNVLHRSDCRADTVQDHMLGLEEHLEEGRFRSP